VKVVLDSNIILAQAIALDYSDRATEKFQQWLEQDTELFTPTLAFYEVASALRKAMVVQQLSIEQVIRALLVCQKLIDGFCWVRSPTKPN
jgi:predicted nucleic acid-binding protein